MRLFEIRKSWYFAQIELYIYVVGRWLAAALHRWILNSYSQTTAFPLFLVICLTLFGVIFLLSQKWYCDFFAVIFYSPLQLPQGNITRLKAVYHYEAIELAVRRIELKRQLQCNRQINKHKSNLLIPPQPKQGGNETKPLWEKHDYRRLFFPFLVIYLTSFGVIFLLSQKWYCDFVAVIFYSPLQLP